MTIQEMHQLFRVVGQQMGMQTIRAILPEEIDVFLNMAINEKIRYVLSSNVINNESKILDNIGISPINYLKTLYKTEYLDGAGDIDGHDFLETIVSDDSEIMFYTSFAIRYKDATIKNARIIEPDKLYNVISDYCSSPSKEYPIVVILVQAAGHALIHIYIGEDDKNNVAGAYVNYIKNPNVVSLEDNIDCDLPNYTHNEIVQLAVQKYFNSVGSTTHNVE